VKITYGLGVIEADELIKSLSFSGQADPAFHGIIIRREAAKRAVELKIAAADEELQEFADHWRIARALFSAKDTLEHLARCGLTVDDFEDLCEQSVLMRKLKDHLAEEVRIRELFVHNRSEFDRAGVSTMTVRDKGLADEILVQVAEEGADFHALARKFSRDESTKHAGGALGLVPRRYFRPDIAAKVFHASAGDVVGPLPEDGAWLLVFVEELLKAELNDRTRDLIKERIFEEWVASFLKDALTVSR